MFTEEIDPVHVFLDPPDLNAAVASARFREINILLHSLALLGDELRGGNSLIPVLRAATAVVPAERALLCRWDDVGGMLRRAAALGFPPIPGAEIPSGDAGARAALLQRKPVLVSAPARESLLRELAVLQAASSLSVPLSHDGLPWGTIQLLRTAPFERDEALLLWLFAQVLEGILPLMTGSRRHSESGASIEESTGQLTPAHFRRRLSWELQRADWLARPVCIVCVEVTEMLHGRPRGRAVPFTPREASQAVRKALRRDDSLTCLGGLHFAAILPDATEVEARHITDLIRDGLLALSASTLPVFDVLTGFAVYPVENLPEADLIRAACARGRRDLSKSPLVS